MSWAIFTICINPVPGRFKDYISTPKPNMYQSLHTTVIGKDGVPSRCRSVPGRCMRRRNTASRPTGNTSRRCPAPALSSSLSGYAGCWKTSRMCDAEDYIQSLKMDMFDDEVFVFTPRGKVISLPSGSTPIDFAYAIHSEVGNHMVGAKVNNRIASYDATLKNGDIVEAITSKSSQGPSRDWLKICKSNQARIKIKQWFKKERRDENIVHGKASFESELRRINVPASALQNTELQTTLLKRVSFDTLDDLYAAIGYGGMTAQKAVNRVQEELLRFTRAASKEETPRIPVVPPHSRHSDSGVIVEGIDSCMIKFARCCTPVPGDDIVGFITKGFGVSIHRRDCPNAAGASDPKQAGRWVKVAWSTEDKPFSTTFEIDSTGAAASGSILPRR